MSSAGSKSRPLLGIARQHLLPALILTMVAGLILGMGMPTTPAYIVRAALLIPALVKMGVHDVAEHLFAIYFAAISAITPPVALAVYAAAGISKARFWDAGVEALKVGAAGFIVPYMFVFGPALLFLGSPTALAVRHRVPVVSIVFHNNMYGTMRMHQERRYPGRPIGWALGDPGFADLRAHGGRGERVTA